MEQHDKTTTVPVAEADVPQATAGTEATIREHAHPAVVHTHDHYHVTHVHRSEADPGEEFDHRAHYHVHEHDHAAYVHAHRYPSADEDAEHARTAHTHDHAAPVDASAKGA